MNNKKLPTDELKKYGIIESDNSFSKKLSPEDIQSFLSGYVMVVDNNNRRITFQLKDNNSKLNVNLYERDKNISKILLDSKNEIQYSDTISKYNINDDKKAAQISWTKSVFVFDEKSNKIVEYDMIKNSSELTKAIVERKDNVETNVYLLQLNKLKSFLQDKLEQYPEISKEISNDINIVSMEIDTVNNIDLNSKDISKTEKSDIQLNVNDRDLFEDANREREEDQELEEDWNRRKGRGR